MEGQQGFIPPTESKMESPQQSGFQQTGFQPTTDEGAKGFEQTGFKPTTDEDSKDFQQTGFQPTDTLTPTAFNSKGFQSTNTGYQPLPDQQKTTISAEKFSEIEQAVKAAKRALDKVNDLISEIAFTPQPNSGFDGYNA